MTDRLKHVLSDFMACPCGCGWKMRVEFGVWAAAGTWVHPDNGKGLAEGTCRTCEEFAAKNELPEAVLRARLWVYEAHHLRSPP